MHLQRFEIANLDVKFVARGSAHLPKPAHLKIIIQYIGSNFKLTGKATCVGPPRGERKKHDVEQSISSSNLVPRAARVLYKDPSPAPFNSFFCLIELYLL
jgi:hypothetical protein